MSSATRSPFRTPELAGRKCAVRFARASSSAKVRRRFECVSMNASRLGFSWARFCRNKPTLFFTVPPSRCAFWHMRFFSWIWPFGYDAGPGEGPSAGGLMGRVVFWKILIALILLLAARRVGTGQLRPLRGRAGAAARALAGRNAPVPLQHPRLAARDLRRLGRRASRTWARCPSGSSRSRSRRARTARSGSSTTCPTACRSSTSPRGASRARCWSATSRATSSSRARATSAPSSPPRTAARTGPATRSCSPAESGAATSGCSTRRIWARRSAARRSPS